ncbi:MAG TPA: RHS repeat-associated core domain-containing protein, partial [Candidatus Levybacteria bacterium]|nr:RHS repeat-associated core domain-containing protein [Candidatus Levybacteria bacterium]
NARYYSSDMRRFTQPDDIIQDVYNPQSLNRYSYVLNNPLKYTDPSGHIIEDACIVECSLMYITALTSSPDFQTDMQLLAKDGADFQDDHSLGNGIAFGISLLSTATPNVPNGGLSKKIGKVATEVAKNTVDPVKSIANKVVSVGNKSLGGAREIVESKANKNNILRINSERISIGPAPKYYEKLNSIQKVLAPIHIHIGKNEIGIDINWFKIPIYKKK